MLFGYVEAFLDSRGLLSREASFALASTWRLMRLSIMGSIWLFLQIGVLSVGVLRIRAPLLGFYIHAHGTCQVLVAGLRALFTTEVTHVRPIEGITSGVISKALSS